MTLHSLPWRIGLPFAAFVLTGSVVLVLLLQFQVAEEHRARLVRQARTNAAFLGRANLPHSQNLAQSLRQVLGVQVAFRAGRRLVGPPDEPVPEALATVPADGEVHRVSALEVVAVPLGDGADLVLGRPPIAAWREVWRAPTFAVLATFWMLAVLVGWLVGRGLVTPLRNLAARLPLIESVDPIELPEARRRDEIGDLARAFLRTREELRRARQKGERAEKLAVLGRMTAALAHEIQNPVAAIKMHAQLWSGGGSDDTARLIEGEAGRIDDLLNQWLFLSRPEPPQTRPVDLGALITQVVQAHRARLDHAGVSITVEARTSTMVEGDARRLSQVVRNILDNAIQAMPRGGPVEIAVRGPEADGMIALHFADRGRGFSAEALERCSEFFFSEKEGGMGIGLSVVSEVVRAHGGRLRVTNRDGGGAVVMVFLPGAH